MKVVIADTSTVWKGAVIKLISDFNPNHHISLPVDLSEFHHALREYEPDIVILDAFLFKPLFRDHLTAIKSQNRQTQVIVVSDAGDNRQREFYLTNGADYYLRKYRDLPIIEEIFITLANKRNGPSYGGR